MILRKNLSWLACAAAITLAAPTPGFATASDRGKSQGQGIGKGLAQMVREHDSRTFQVQENADLAFMALTGAASYWGRYEGIQGPASYTAEFPDNWNGGVIMYTHGFRGEGSTVTREVPNLAFRNTALALGYAWAASSILSQLL